MKRTVFIGFLSALVFGIAVSSLTCAQTSDSSLCGIPLRPSVARLKLRVERRFGKPVQCQSKTGLHEQINDFGFGGVLHDGTPVIVLDQELGLDETEVAHELSHLELISEGFTGFIPHPPQEIDTDRFAYAVKQLNNVIQHRIIYPEMRAMGLDPLARHRKIPSINSHPGPARDVMLNTIAYVGITAVMDIAFVRKVDAVYRKNGWNEGLSKGKLIVDSIRRANVQKPNQEQGEILSCLDILFGQKFGAAVLEPEASLRKGSR